ncbi:MAG: histidine kinase dimerization/phospho-acceptor domain-containing protein [Lachnospiraceae bacterium]
MAALAHDIKTPLTIIRGNAELVQETEDLEEIREWDREILDGARRLEGYLAVSAGNLAGAGRRPGQRRGGGNL